ncbi:MAG: MotA/TolQ/ExbB proton channel family protein [Phycisphaerales bacterium]|nr:MAG: MotA/TolQ/ExbB proton channel family protein [Phycisphaerales bacterium]
MRIMKPLFALGAAADLVIVLYCVVGWRFDPGDRMHDFLFDRSPVQYATLFAFALAIVILSCRLIRYLRSKSELRRIRRSGNCGRMPNSALGEHMRTMKETLNQYGVGAAFACHERFAQLQEDESQQGYELLNFLVCSLPALGLFGTMIGLSDGLFKAFSEGLAENSIQKFVGSLGTALDTTVLALACALIAGTVTWVFNRMEKRLRERRNTFVGTSFGLDRACHESVPTRSVPVAETHDSDVSETLRTDLRTAVAESMAGISSTFAECLTTLEDLARTNSELLVQNGPDRGRQLDVANLTESVTSCLHNATDQIGELIRTQNAEVVRTVASAVNRFAEALEASNVIDTVRAEVRASMSENMTEVNLKLQTHLEKLEEVVRTGLDHAIQIESQAGAHFDQTDLVESMTSCLDGAMERIGNSVVEQCNQGMQTIAAALKESAKATNARMLQALITYNSEHELELNNVA